MTNSELKEYAAANRSRLKKQKVALGDWVMILVGEFVGKNGVIKGISVCGNDFTDPYYEVDMACEVPDKYKCRKTLIQSNNVIGGLSASEFEVICSRTPESDIKEAEPKPKFKEGDKVRFGEVGKPMKSGVIIEVHDTGTYHVFSQDGKMQYVPEEALSHDTEPTAGEEEQRIRKAGEELQERMADHLDRIKNPEKYCAYTIETPAWQSYRMELAAKIAVAYSEKGRYEPYEIGAKAVEVANGVVERLKNGEV